MVNPRKTKSTVQTEMANRLLFKLYQCANMLHKTGTKAVEEEGLTTQQWAVLGALSRPAAEGGMSVGDLARYLLVSRQSLSGLIGRMERDGHVAGRPDGNAREELRHFGAIRSTQCFQSPATDHLDRIRRVTRGAAERHR